MAVLKMYGSQNHNSGTMTFTALNGLYPTVLAPIDTQVPTTTYPAPRLLSYFGALPNTVYIGNVGGNSGVSGAITTTSTRKWTINYYTASSQWGAGATLTNYICSATANLNETNSRTGVWYSGNRFIMNSFRSTSTGTYALTATTSGLTVVSGATSVSVNANTEYSVSTKIDWSGQRVYVYLNGTLTLTMSFTTASSVQFGLQMTASLANPGSSVNAYYFSIGYTDYYFVVDNADHANDTTGFVGAGTIYSIPIAAVSDPSGDFTASTGTLVSALGTKFSSDGELTPYVKTSARSNAAAVTFNPAGTPELTSANYAGAMVSLVAYRPSDSTSQLYADAVWGNGDTTTAQVTLTSTLAPLRLYPGANAVSYDNLSTLTVHIKSLRSS